MTRPISLLGFVGFVLGSVAIVLTLIALAVSSTSPTQPDLQSLLIAVAIGAGGASTAGLLVWLAARRQLARLAELARTVREADVGTREPGALPGTSHDLAQLSSAIDSLRTRLQQAFEDEAAERGRLESVFAAMPDGVLVVDGSGHVRFGNEAAVEILGASSGEPRGKRLIDMTRANEIYELAMAAAGQNRVGMREIELLPSRRFVNVMGLPVASAADRRTEGRAVLVIKDVTELHRIEVTRKEFISNASHELRTPVAAIKALAETLQAGAVDDPEARAEFLARIVQDADRMDRMLAELLQLSRLESGQTPLHLEPVDCAAFARDVCSRFQSMADAKGISLSRVVNQAVPLVTADLDKLHQLLGNLMSNALKATPAGGSITLTVDRSDRFIEMRVSDTGTGIDPEHLPHIFERFYKADRARTDDGAGLGLAIAKHIALAHQGEISVRSRPGEGSTFTVRLPVPVGFEETNPPGGSAAQPAEAT